VTGTGFATGAATSFKFGKVAATGVDCTSTTSCTMTAPPSKKGALGTVDITAKAGKTSGKTPDDHYTYE
jgi:hypothetical protein